MFRQSLSKSTSAFDISRWGKLAPYKSLMRAFLNQQSDRQSFHNGLNSQSYRNYYQGQNTKNNNCLPGTENNSKTFQRSKNHFKKLFTTIWEGDL